MVRSASEIDMPAMPRGPTPAKPRRVLIAGLDGQPAAMLRRAFERAGAGEAEITPTLDEALDVLGNAGRPVDVMVAVLMPNDKVATPLLEILRRHRAPLAVIALSTWGVAGLGVGQPTLGSRLVGIAAYVPAPARLDDIVQPALSAHSSGWTMRRILDQRTVPPALAVEVAAAIYEALPGETFTLPSPDGD
jgi:hypothetical protein